MGGEERERGIEGKTVMRKIDQLPSARSLQGIKPETWACIKISVIPENIEILRDSYMFPS